MYARALGVAPAVSLSLSRGEPWKPRAPGRVPMLTLDLSRGLSALLITIERA